MNKYRICKKCDVWHFENCDTCFGFGLKSNNTPISAGMAHDLRLTNSIENTKPCPECHSTIYGIGAMCELD